MSILLEQLLPGLQGGINSRKNVDFSQSGTVALPTNTTVNGVIINPSGGSVIDLGTIEAYDPTGTTKGNWHNTVSLTGSTVILTTGFTNPAKPRLVYIDDQDSVGSGIFAIVGTDSLNAPLSESVDISQGNQSNNAFKTITQITCPSGKTGHFDFSTGSAVGLAQVYSSSQLNIPTVNGSSQINFVSLQNGWSMDTSFDATHVSLNLITLGSGFAGGHLILHLL